MLVSLLQRSLDQKELDLIVATALAIEGEWLTYALREPRTNAELTSLAHRVAEGARLTSVLSETFVRRTKLGQNQFAVQKDLLGDEFGFGFGEGASTACSIVASAIALSALRTACNYSATPLRSQS